ncbi:MAG: hypothetical protein ACTSYB_19195 [Candidatus Helarchaeota archaeon]
MKDQIKQTSHSVFKAIKDLFLTRGISLQEDQATHRRTLRNGFLAAFSYSVGYGIYEYFLVYHNLRIIDYIGSEINWLIMYIGLLLTVALATRFCIEQMIMGLLLMAVFEDLIFWLCQWIDTGLYPFPAGNWWDLTIASFQALGGLGWAIPFWPYIPFYYIPGFAMITCFYIASYINALYSRIVAWTFGPIFVAIIAGALGTVDFARIMLIIIPLVSYTYLLGILLLKKKMK